MPAKKPSKKTDVSKAAAQEPPREAPDPNAVVCRSCGVASPATSTACIACGQPFAADQQPAAEVPDRELYDERGHVHTVPPDPDTVEARANRADPGAAPAPRPS